MRFKFKRLRIQLDTWGEEMQTMILKNHENSYFLTSEFH